MFLSLHQNVSQLHHYAYHLIQLLSEENYLNEGSRGLAYNLVQATYLIKDQWQTVHILGTLGGTALD